MEERKKTRVKKFKKKIKIDESREIRPSKRRAEVITILFIIVFASILITVFSRIIFF